MFLKFEIKENLSDEWDDIKINKFTKEKKKIYYINEAIFETCNDLFDPIQNLRNNGKFSKIFFWEFFSLIYFIKVYIF